MIKRMLSAALLLVSAITAGAQMPQMQPMPLNPDVKHGKLPNGMEYFILHNEFPKDRANFYIAQKVGSTLETSEQLGLAHFLEHMAFNGTTHYPGKTMLNYLQAKGIRFGADINAYTDFDETVYNINNVPTSDVALMDSVLLVLHDWSGEILLEEDEINAERGVIEEEWRMRNSGFFRMYETILPSIYQEYQYQQMPIGKMEIVRNFPPEALRSYYKKWYRPDQQGIVIVGDFDAADMEKKVIDLFSKIPMPENAAERTYPSVSDNKEPIFVFYEDPELQYPRMDLAFKYDMTPFEMRNTVAGYVQDNLLEAIIAKLINNRLSEYMQKTECKYAYAGVRFDKFLVSKTKDAFNVVVIGKNDITQAFEEAAGIIARACKAGFTDSELSRVRDEMIASFEKSFNERNNTQSESLAKELIRHFVDNEPAPGISAEFELVKQILPALPVQAINEVARQLLTPENQVMIVSQPKREGMTVVTREQVVPVLEKALNAEYEAYVDEVITDPLIAKLPKPGKIKSQKEGKFGTTVLTLSNGVKVVVKPTDFKSDEILMTAFRDGGMRSYAASDAPNVLLAGDAFNYSKLGKFDMSMLRKYLSGKRAVVGYGIGGTSNSLGGKSTVKDLPTLMELVYASFTDLNPDETTYNAQMDQIRTLLRNNDKDPKSVFERSVSSAKYGNNPMFMPVDVATIDAASYPKMVQMLKESMANAANYTFVFVGNIDMKTFRPLLEQYIATLPSKGKADAVKKLSPITLAKGKIDVDLKHEMQTPSTRVYDVYSDTNIPYSIENDIKISMIGSILGNIFTETLREEEGGTYSPHAWADLNPYTGEWTISYNFETNAKQQASLIKRAEEELNKLLANGADQANFNKVKEANLKQYEMAVRYNGYWQSCLIDAEMGIDNITNHREILENLTLEDFNKFMKTLYNGKNRIQVVMEGVEMSK